MKLTTIVSCGVLALAACSGPGDEVVPIDAPVAIDAPPPIDGPPAIDAATDAPTPVDGPTPAGCVTTISALTVNEGATATVSVMMSAMPQGATTCTVEVADPTAITAVPLTLVFTPGNWDVAQIVTVTGVQDANTEDENTTLTISTSGSPSAILTVVVVDDD